MILYRQKHIHRYILNIDGMWNDSLFALYSAVPKDMTINVMNIRPGGWTRLTITDTGGDGVVESVALRVSGFDDDWIPMENKWGAAWEIDALPEPPLDFKITMSDGEQIVAEKVITNAFYFDGGISNPLKFNTGIQATISETAGPVQVPDGEFDPMLIVEDSDISLSILEAKQTEEDEEGVPSEMYLKPPVFTLENIHPHISISEHQFQKIISLYIYRIGLY